MSRVPDAKMQALSRHIDKQLNGKAGTDGEFAYVLLVMPWDEDEAKTTGNYVSNSVDRASAVAWMETVIAEFKKGLT